MNDFQATESSAEADAEPLFTVAEVEELTNEDVIAGRAIGKMLSVLFLYTVVAMIVVTSWTFWSLFTNHGVNTGTEASSTTHQ